MVSKNQVSGFYANYKDIVSVVRYTGMNEYVVDKRSDKKDGLKEPLIDSTAHLRHIFSHLPYLRPPAEL